MLFILVLPALLLTFVLRYTVCTGAEQAVAVSSPVSSSQNNQQNNQEDNQEDEPENDIRLIRHPRPSTWTFGSFSRRKRLSTKEHGQLGSRSSTQTQAQSGTGALESSETAGMVPDGASFPVSEPGTPQSVHSLVASQSAWGDFRPGSWFRSRTTATTYDGTRVSRSITETKMTLLAVEPDALRLRREITIKMGAVNHTKPPEDIRIDFFGVQQDTGITVTELLPASVAVTRRVIPCQVRQVEKQTDQRLESTIFWYSSVVAPYILQKETRIYDVGTPEAPKKTVVGFSQTTISRTSANMRLGNPLTAYREEISSQNGNCTSHTVIVHSTLVPGQTTRGTTVEKDANGRVLYESETTLLEYFTARE